MKVQIKTRMPLKFACPLVLSLGILAGLHGTVSAQGNNSGSVDFCDASVYDNTLGELGTYPNSTSRQTSGMFTDVSRWQGTNYRPDQINRDSAAIPCALVFFGGANSNRDMWITLLGTPGTTPIQNSCWSLKANFKIDHYDNAKSVGFVTNYDTATKRGLFFGMTDNGNTDRVKLYTFDASASGSIPITELASSPAAPLDLHISEGAWYTMTLDICSGPKDPGGTGPLYLSAIGSWQPVTFSSPNNWTYTNPPGTCPSDKANGQFCITYQGLLPATISASGAAGLAGMAQFATEYASVAKFNYVVTDQAAD